MEYNNPPQYGYQFILGEYKLTVTNLRDTYGERKFVILDKDTVHVSLSRTTSDY